MNRITKTNKNSFLQKPGFWRKRSLGQNFLVNTGIFKKVLNAAELNKNDTVLEIGAGTGNLTQRLAEKVHHLVAIEKDSRFIKLLKEKFNNSNTNIVGGDVLRVGEKASRSLASGEYKIVGNIPYYITSHLLKTIFEKWPMPKLIVFMVQKEVAQRITITRPSNLLGLSVQFYAEPKIISYVSRGNFRPIPKVDSAIIRLIPHPEVPPEAWLLEERKRFFKLIKTAFAGKRKQLKNTIGKEILEKTGIKPESRPEELSLEDWLKIASKV